MQLTVEQRVFVVAKYFVTKSYNAVTDAFQQRFREHNPPTKRTIYQNVKNTTITAQA